MKKKKPLTISQCWELFEKKRNKVNILLNALDHMEHSSKRSVTECVALAMGVELESFY